MTGFLGRWFGTSKRQTDLVEVPHPTADIMVVCTANICRSPMGEAFLRAALAAQGSSLSVTSAGFLEDGRRVDPLSVQGVRNFGVDISGHRSARMTLHQLEAAKVILCMTTEHRRRVAGFRTTFYAKTFTLHEFVERSLRLDVATRAQGFDRWLPMLRGERTGRELLLDDDRISVADPYGEGAAAHEATARLLSDLCRQIAEIVSSPSENGN